MTPDTRQQLKEVGGTVAIIGAVLAAGILSVPSGKTFSFSWKNDTAHPWEKYRVSEVQATTNFVDWYSITNTTSNAVTLPRIKEWEFFRIKNHYTNVSGW